MALLIPAHGRGVQVVLAEQMIVHAEAFLDAQDERNAGVIKQMLADVGRVDEHVDSVLLELPCSGRRR